MIPLPGVPAFITPRLIAGVAVAAALVLSGWMARAKWDGARFVQLQLEQSQRVAVAEQKARQAIESVRAREQALIESTQGIVNDARKTIEGLERGFAAADAASAGMLDAAKRAAGRCSTGASSAAAKGGPAAIVPGGMSDGDRFLRVLGELNAFAGAAAEDSGRARAAVEACVKAYNAVMTEVNK
jgi:hypothetical protein